MKKKIFLPLIAVALITAGGFSAAKFINSDSNLSNKDLLFYCFAKNIPDIGVHDKKSGISQICKLDNFKKHNGIQLNYLCGYSSNCYVFTVDTPGMDDEVSDKFRNWFSGGDNAALLMIKFNMIINNY